MHKNNRPKWKRVICSVLIDVLLTGIALIVFAYFHRVRPRASEDENLVIARPPKAVQAATATPSPDVPVQVTADNTPTAPPETASATVSATAFVYTPDMDEMGSFRVKYRDHFTGGEVLTGTAEDGKLYYRSANLDITVTQDRVTIGTHTSDTYVVDFYVSDITCLKSIFAHDKFAKGEYEWLNEMAKRAEAVVAINGDFASMRNYGVVIRDGHVYRSSHSSFDACAINWDGTMATYYSDDWDTKTLIARGAYMAWSFGPKLLDANGQPCKKFNATDAVLKANPRTAIGYFEPGHYCFVVVDGRSDRSRGFTMAELSQYMSDLGCAQAYNLDGGESSSLWWQGKILSKPYGDGRKISDAVCLGEIGGVAQ